MPVAVLWPFVLAIVAYTSYQLVLKLVRPDVHILAVLAFAYLVSCATAVTLWLMNPGLGDSRLQGRDMMMAALIGVSIVGIEFGFASAYPGRPADEHDRRHRERCDGAAGGADRLCRVR